MKTIFKNCTLLDGSENMTPQQNMCVVVDHGTIVSIICDTDDTHTQIEKLSSGQDVKLIDLQGKYLMPGLINLHVHLPGNGAPKKKQQDSTKAAKFVMKNALTRKIGMKLCSSYAKTELLSGVTTIRTVGGLGNLDSLIRNDIENGKRTGPRMLVCNMAVSVPGGHMAGSVAYPAESEQEARNLVKEIAKEKPDWIKLMITGGVLDAKVKGEPGVLKMPPTYVAACCEEAHKLGFKVAAHVESPEGVRVALENGVDSIEHGAALDESLISLFKSTGAYDVCTISPSIPLALFDPSILNSTELMQYNGDIVMKGIIGCAKDALANGIPVGLGTDTACPFVTHYDMWRELYYFHKYVGVSNTFALFTATKKNAEIAGVLDVTGSIELEKSADFLITERNPLNDLKALRTPYMVVMKGQIYKQPKVKKITACEQELDKYL